MSTVKVAFPSVGKPGPINVQTMGCKVNHFESTLIGESISLQISSGAGDDRVNGVQIINTCTVTGEADRQARQLVRRTIRNHPDDWVVVTGCYAQTDPEACAAIPGVDLVVGNSQKLDIPKLLQPMMAGELPKVLRGDIHRQISLPDDLPNQLISGYDEQTRAFVQVQQGCDQGCTFCIIHTARGPNRSFSPAMIHRQVERLVINGYREIVLCGVDIGSFGNDFDSPYPLARLLDDLISIEGDFRLRLSSIDPVHLDDQLIEVMASSDKVCPQLHLSMQSGNTLILKRMKRRATREVLYQRVDSLRKAKPDLVLSADVLVGFPTETDQHFAETLEAIDQLDIAFPHVFAYSARPGTPAARIPKQVPHPVRKERARAARRAGRAVWLRIAQGLVGTRQRVLVESAGDPSREDHPDLDRGRAANYYLVEFGAKGQVSNRWQEVEITGVGDHALFARSVA